MHYFERRLYNKAPYYHIDCIKAEINIAHRDRNRAKVKALCKELRECERLIKEKGWPPRDRC